LTQAAYTCIIVSIVIETILNQRRTMTLPDERYRAVKQAEQLLRDLCDPSKTPRIPKLIRQRASGCLRHYPSQWDMQRAAAASPEVFQEQMEDLHRFVSAGQRRAESEDPRDQDWQGYKEM
jgi:hypothetical protein